jgi:hypothetical protein
MPPTKKPRARRLKELAEAINKKYPMWEATIEKGYCNTDSQVAGTRFLRRGKGRTGNKLVVRWRHLYAIDPTSKVFEHNAAETYRCNEEVERWLEYDAPKLSKQPKPVAKKGWPYS